ncbi:unnamed protein product, partial [Closterium sp. NIES-53]
TAIDAEMASWKSTGTYVDEVPPSRANIVSGMWIFRVKRPPGSPPVFKARYVARGFSQREGVDFFLTFSPTLKMTTLRGSLHEEIWLRRPPGFTGSFPPGTQWSLRRPVYGLRQAPREWHDTMRTTLAALGFAPSTADPSLFLRTDTSLPPFYVLVYVDDLVFATADTEALALVKSELQNRHTCTDLGELRSYLGLQITQDRARRTITLTQSHMVQQVLQRFGFTWSSAQATPLATCHSLSAPPSDESVEPSGLYSELVGCLMYLMTCTRPDLAYPLGLLARYVAPGRHRKVHMDAAKRVLRYLCSTSGMGLVLGGQGDVVLTGHSDASWVDDQTTQRSSQGYTFSLGSGSVSWRSTRSSSVLGSSGEAEIYATAMAAQELRWLTYLLTDLGERPRSPLVLYVDNKAAIALCQEHRMDHRTKHIALRYFLARELLQRGQLRLTYVATGANTADIFTKALPPGDHQRFCTLLGLVPTLPHLLLCGDVVIHPELALHFLTGLVTLCSSPLCLWGSIVAEQQDMDLQEEKHKRKTSVSEFAFHTQRRYNNNNHRQNKYQSRLRCGGSISEDAFVTVVIGGLGPHWRSTRAILRAHGKISEAALCTEIHAEQQDMDLQEEKHKRKTSVSEFAFHTQRRYNNNNHRQNKNNIGNNRDNISSSRDNIGSSRNNGSNNSNIDTNHCTDPHLHEPADFPNAHTFASTADEADWDEQNVDRASEEAAPLPSCSVDAPMDDENPRESANADVFYHFADNGYVTPAEVNTNEAARIGLNFIPDPETGDEAAYPADTTLPRYTQSGLQILGLVTAVHGTEIPKEPATVQQALGGEHREKWRGAMDKELKALEECNTWKFVPIGIARNKTVLTRKWVFRVKTKADGTIDKFKVRWVVRGFDQEHGRDFTETFAPVSRHTSLRILLAIAAMKKKKLRQIDVANAFLYAPVDAEIFVELPHGSHGEPNQVCQLQKSLYDIKQAPRLWQQYLQARLTRIGFRQLPHDQGMYRITKDTDYILLIVYVDDL